MNSLIIDTATKNLYLAIAKDDTLLKEIILNDEKEHSKNIMIKIDELFSSCKLTIDNIDSIIVGIGPGSYTGIRIGVTVAKMFAWTKSIPLYEISSLFLMSSGYKGMVAPYIDARRGNVFAGIYEDGKEIMKEAHLELKAFKELAKDALMVTDVDFSVDVKKVIVMKKETNMHACSPNYLRETEAERNIKGR